MVRLVPIIAGALLLAACSQGEGDSANVTADSAEEVERVSAVDIEEPADEPAEIPSSQPQIAYTFDYGFRVPADKIAGLQEKHADMCLKLAANSCRIVAMQRDGGEGDYGNGTLQIAVAADRARGFGNTLVTTVESEGGEQVAASITGEDLSKQMVDTEARLRARRVLRDRLMEVLATRRGTVAELVEAERGVAQVNEEIDQAQSWLAEMRQRVAYSVMTVEYRSGTPAGGGFAEPIRSALGNFGTIIGVVLGVLITVLAVAIPLALIGGAVWYLWRFLRRYRRKDEIAVTEGTEDERQTARIS